MPNSYFRQLPSFEYVSRVPDAKIGDFIEVKNIFKRGFLREDIFSNLAFFEKYKIEGNERPDNIAYKVYNDSNLDWVVLMANNIINIQTEWPMENSIFDLYLRDKYGKGLSTEEEIYNNIYNGVHHYETKEVKNRRGVVIVPAGLQVEDGYSVSYYDYIDELQIDSGNIAVPVTNYQYEEKIDNDKRNIYLLKQRYLNIVLDDMQELMAYKEGSSQYKTETLKRANDIRLFE